MASNTAQSLKGYDNQFVESPSDDLLCLICLCVARDPQQINCCGKVLCKTCLDEHKRYSNKCPQCRKKIASFADKRSERDILSLKVKCDNTTNGCKWIGELRSVEKHLTSCEFTLLPCPNKCKNGSKTLKLLRKDIEVHKKVCPRRRCKCPHCLEAGEYQERTTTHRKECPKMKIFCPNEGCDERIKRCEISQHRQKCLFESVPCKYAKISCGVNVLRKDIEDHQNDSQQHLQLAIDTVQKHEEKIAQLQSTPMKFKVTNFDKLITDIETFYSPAFYTSPGGYKMRISMDANGDDGHVSVYAYLMRGENDDHLPWPFTGTVTVELLNQLEDDNHHTHKITFHPDDEVGQRVANEVLDQSSIGYGSPLFIPHSEIGYNAAKHCQYLKDDCLFFRVKVDAESIKPWLV